MPLRQEEFGVTSSVPRLAFRLAQSASHAVGAALPQRFERIQGNGAARECLQELLVHRHELDIEFFGQRNELAVIRQTVAVTDQFEHAG